MFDPKPLAESFFGHVHVIPASGVVQQDEVRALCERNACGVYGKNWCCPPAVAPLDEWKKRFEPFDTFLVVYEVYPVKDSFDWKGMMDAMDRFKKRLHDMKNALDEAADGSGCLVLGAGSCGVCKACTYPDGEPCRAPGKAIVSLEACGIDVMKLMRVNEMTDNNGPNTVTYVGGVFYHS